jgi:hypothetical protein
MPPLQQESRAPGLVRVSLDAFSSLAFDYFQRNGYCSVFAWGEQNFFSGGRTMLI